MKPNRLQGAIVAPVLAIAGAILTFALTSDDTSAVGVRLKTLGIIVLVAGIILLAGIWITGVQGSGGEDATDGSGSAHIVGSVAVLAAIAGGCILAAVTLTYFAPEDKDSVVAVTTSAFGIISAVVGAYLGIKTADNAHERAAKVAGAAISAEREGSRRAKSLHAAINSELSRRQLRKVLEKAADIESKI